MSPTRNAFAQGICQRRGWRYILHTEQTLPSGYCYTNLDFLSRFRAQAYADADLTQWWLTHLTGATPIHPQSLLSGAPCGLAHGLLLNTLYHLLWHDHVQMDWQRPLIWQGALHAAARVWLPTAACPQEHPKEVAW